GAGHASRPGAERASRRAAADLDAARRRRVGWIGHAASLGLPLQFLSRQPQSPMAARPAASMAARPTASVAVGRAVSEAARLAAPVAARAPRNHRPRNGSAPPSALTPGIDSTPPLNP